MPPMFTVEQRDRIRRRILEMAGADPRIGAGAAIGSLAEGDGDRLSFTPASEFGALGPKFKLLFGAAVQRPHPERPTAHHLFGLGVHHAVRARFCIERGRPWQAQYWIGGVRDQALLLACLRRGLEVS